jgi:histidinol phosphatase-like PHP family hydrolase
VIDLHTHTLFSDGELLPAELIQRADAMGHRGIALTDHVDTSNLDFILPRIRAVVNELNRHHKVRALAGVELTHVPPELINDLTLQARDLGADIVVAHGETIVEPVPPGTNRASIEAGVDILAHPGLITAEEVALAAEKGVHLEISARKGHCLGNGHTVALARAAGALLVVDTDAHAPSDLINRAMAEKVVLGAGVPPEELETVFANSERLLARAGGVEV